MDLQALDENFMQLAEDVGDILRGVGRNWNAEEQLDNDNPDEADARRFALGYAFAEATADGSITPPHVDLWIWYGPTGTVIEGREGKEVRLELGETDEKRGYVKITFVPEHEQDFLINGDHLVHSLGELRDRLTLMWNANEFGVVDKREEENRPVRDQYRTYGPYVREQIRGVIAVMGRMGKAWGGEEQTDNRPDDTRRTGLIPVAGASGPKRYCVSYLGPHLAESDGGLLQIDPGRVWLDLWLGPKGELQKSKRGRVLKLKNPSATRIVATFDPAETVIKIGGQQAATAAEFKDLMVTMWKRGAFELPG